MLKKHPFLFYFETCEELVFKAFSLLRTVQFSHSILSDSLCNMDCSTPGFSVHQQFPQLGQTQFHWIGDAFQPSHPLSSSSLAFNLSQHQDLFQWASFHIRWPNYWRFSFSISPSNEYSGLISFRIGWFDLLAVQGTPKCLLQQHSPKASILWHSAFFIVQLSHQYMTNKKTLALTYRPWSVK